ncbi:MAG TPA: RDD family protein [Steroidobacteraceae bacterium]|nr:RDD family protein [Steroidobacteraceae bacterium]
MHGAGAGTFRQLAAATYDGLLLTAVLMLVTALLQVLTHGEAITRASVGGFEYLYRAVLALCVAAYFGSSWTRSGQTLGMKAWGIRLQTASGGLSSWRDAALRLVIAAPLYLLAIAGVVILAAHRGGWLLLLACGLPLALSFAWNAATGAGTLQDRWSRTRVVRVPRRRVA